MSTMREVAALAGVSVATVSHVVNDTRKISPATRARVEQAIARLGFQPDPVGRMLSMRKSVDRHAAPQPAERTASSVVASQPGRDDEIATLASEPAPRPLTTSIEASDSNGSPARATRMLLRLVRAAQPISRIELARRLGLNRSTVTDAFKPLIAAGVLREAPLEQTAVQVAIWAGRPWVCHSIARTISLSVSTSACVVRKWG